MTKKKKGEKTLLREKCIGFFSLYSGLSFYELSLVFVFSVIIMVLKLEKSNCLCMCNFSVMGLLQVTRVGFLVHAFHLSGASELKAWIKIFACHCMSIW